MLHTRPTRRWFTRHALASVVAGALLTFPGAWAAPAGAAQWCELDPPVAVITRGGRKVVVHVTVYGLGQIHQAAVNAAKIDHVARPGNDRRGTAVTIFVVVPGDKYDRAFPTRSVVSTEPHGQGQILASETSQSGRAMRLQFTLGVA